MDPTTVINLSNDSSQSPVKRYGRARQASGEATQTVMSETAARPALPLPTTTTNKKRRRPGRMYKRHKTHEVLSDVSPVASSDESSASSISMTIVTDEASSESEEEDVDTVDDIEAEQNVEQGGKSTLIPRGRIVSFEKLLFELVFKPVEKEMDNESVATAEASVPQNQIQRSSHAALAIQRYREDMMKEHVAALNLDAGSKNTTRNYRTYLIHYKNYCDKKHAGEGDARYEVTEGKVVAFFQDVMFKLMKHKFFYQDKDYTKPFPVYRTIQDAPPNACVISRRVGDDSSQQVSQGVNPISSILENLPRNPYTRASGLSTSVQNWKLTVVDMTEGRKTLQVPLGRETMLISLKALVFLHSRQRTRRLRPNGHPNLRQDKTVTSLIDNYLQGLVWGTVNATRDYTCDAYSVPDHVRLLLDCWVNHPRPALPLWPNDLALRAREHFALAIRHSMLLHDEDLRNLNLSDCFMDQLDTDETGTQTLSMLLFTFHRSKTDHTGKQKF
ncbi:hypothetical protein DFQ26_001615, partial [Actinomortierella ambigua]